MKNRSMKMSQSVGRLARLVFWSSGAVFLIARTQAALFIDLETQGPIVLQPGAAGQNLDVFVRNDGDSIAVGGFDLRIGIVGNLSPAPAITGVTLNSGPLFTALNSAQSADKDNGPQAQFWSVSLNVLAEAPLLSGGGALTRVGTLSLSTIGVGTGSWALELSFPQTDFSSPIGTALPVSVLNGTLQVVPEPSVAVSVAGLGLLAFVLLRRTSRPGNAVKH